MDVDEARGASILLLKSVAPGLELPSQEHVSAEVLGLTDAAAGVSSAAGLEDLVGEGRGDRVEEARLIWLWLARHGGKQRSGDGRTRGLDGALDRGLDGGFGHETRRGRRKG